MTDARQPPAPVRDLLKQWAWTAFAGPLVTPDEIAPLIAAGAPAWIIVETIDEDGSCLADPKDLAAAARAATHVIIAPDIDEVEDAAGALAAAGGRVLVIERRRGSPLPASLLAGLAAPAEAELPIADASAM
jgi:hypothetical protein